MQSRPTNGQTATSAEPGFESAPQRQEPATTKWPPNAGNSRWSAHLDSNHYHRLELPASDWDGPDCRQVLSGWSTAEYHQALLRAAAYLKAGDIFQVNLAQQLIVPLRHSSTEFYRRMRHFNQAPFAAYFELGNHQLISASPERLVSVRGDRVETRPIKGTCRLTGDMDADARAAGELGQSEKNCAENIMIVDLLRNDLSRICLPESIEVTQLCGLETYRHVQHLVSVIRGRLPAAASAWDLLPALFPGGSITGAPKVRAMEIINELEPLARGAYCGSLGYIAFPAASGRAHADWNILIRTATLCGQWCQIPVGGGIVLGSDPAAEFRETLDKARGMLLAASQ